MNYRNFFLYFIRINGTQINFFLDKYRETNANDFVDYSVSGNNSTILYDAGINEYTFNNTSTSDPYAEISQKAYLTANTPYTIHADFKTTGGTKITGSSEIFQMFYRTMLNNFISYNNRFNHFFYNS